MLYMLVTRILRVNYAFIMATARCSLWYLPSIPPVTIVLFLSHLFGLFSLDRSLRGLFGKGQWWQKYPQNSTCVFIIY